MLRSDFWALTKNESIKVAVEGYWVLLGRLVELNGFFSLQTHALVKIIVEVQTVGVQDLEQAV